MIYRLNILVISLILVFGHSSFGQKNDIKSVKQSFEKYKSAILSDKGEEAVAYVDSRTVDYYSYVLELVLGADSAKVEALSVFDKLMVFSIRHRVSKEEILNFNGKSLLVYAIKSGMVGKNSVNNGSIGDVTIEGDFAKGQLVANGQKSPYFFHFYKEEGHWKIDLTSLFPVARSAFQKMVEDREQSPNEYLFSLLELITGKIPGPEIWIPVRHKDGNI